MAGDRLIYIGTMEGLYVAEQHNGGYTARPLGLQGKGAIRAPVVVDGRDPRRLYAVTSRAGVFRSEDGGQTWHECNEGIVYREVWSIAQAPQTGTLYIGTGPAVVYKSTDGGDTWTECEHIKTLPTTKDWTFPNPPHVAHVKGLAIHPDDPDFVFGAVEEGWLVRTKDGGRTWENIKEGTDFDSHYVAFVPGFPNVVLSTAGEGFYRSEDGGDHFVESIAGLEQRYLAQVVVHPARPQVLFTAGAAVPPPGWRRPEGADAGFYRSEDLGRSWHRLTGGLPAHIHPAPRAVANDPADPDTVCVGLTDGTIWLTENGGESFRQILAGLPQIGSLSLAHR